MNENKGNIRKYYFIFKIVFTKETDRIEVVTVYCIKNGGFLKWTKSLNSPAASGSISS